jgi:Flp pilus assembly protein TadB
MTIDDQSGEAVPPSRRTGSLAMIVLVFGLLTIVVLAILLGALFVAIGVVVLAVPAAFIARMLRRRRQRAG